MDLDSGRVSAIRGHQGLSGGEQPLRSPKMAGLDAAEGRETGLRHLPNAHEARRPQGSLLA